MDLIAKLRSVLGGGGLAAAKADLPESAPGQNRPAAAKPAPVVIESEWTRGALAAPLTEPARQAIAHALTAAGKSKPSQLFLKRARPLMAADSGLASEIMGWLEAYTPDPHRSDPNEDTMRGLLWMLAIADDDAMASRIGKFCELCFKKIPNVGARSIKLGNGALVALATMAGPHAIAELTRLKSRVRYPVVVGRIETMLAEIASAANVSQEELEEMSLPTYDLSADGELRLPIGPGSAIIRVAGTREVALSFARADGRETNSVPKELKDAAPDALAAARALRKEIEGTLIGQAARIERLYLTNRAIPFENWRRHYLEHPLLSALVQRLIWCFTSAGTSVVGQPHGRTIEDVTGKQLVAGPDTTVTLWHPLTEEADTVLAWRRRLATLGVVQPFKQAHREIYLLTDAERRTDLYSNRFAAHLLRQHQFKALCDQRGWHYHLMGAWDSHNTPTRFLPQHGLAVEFWVNMVDSETTAAAIYRLIATDQVRFIGGDGGQMALADVPPLLFSELMRDVDLFVGVASLGNDPNWSDAGPEGRFRTYWNSVAFGDLSEAAKIRREVLASLLPALKIADRCKLRDRFLTVNGRIRSYKIHLGSGNIQMAPNDQYLCIVPGLGLSSASDRIESLVLPFEGDITLSIILSKAFLLAADDKITDPSILSQIKRA